ncbi:acyloxyacyl hydrolase isoform X1 [Cricetulus griseus]|uniref:Acyloxyacyl hydrolase n=1 Tax=Cricetulus griseus TaxID=10029 RepID=A0A061ID38_CRIGR|nr:acyloxyacyl hydrolase isoform X1 [Cricetulus griseus]XP_027265169.1 acyloxyacyl hydrolase isoform X1 [Cricetulus griseus]ERE79837.1 acyloxyacyl hydrolase isoform 1 [Cricetulus griseus]
MKSPWETLKATPLFLLLLSHSLASAPYEDQPGTSYSNGHNCVGCVVVVSVIEQLAEVHNSSVQVAMERLCSYLPEKLFLKTTCYYLVQMFGSDIIKLLGEAMNADVVCHALEFCKQDAVQSQCHLYPLPQEAWKFTLEKAKHILKRSSTVKYHKSGSNICSLPFLAKICQKIELSVKKAVPFKDVDSDKYSVFPTLRGYHWRGRDCNDSDKTVYPGRRPDNWDVHQDSNCNGIWGIDPNDGIPYEKKFCEGSQPRGIILLGDSAGAHFHIPPEWLTASQMSLKSFFNLPSALTDELNWPQLSGVTGFLDSTSGIEEKSIYHRLRKRNHCNHRDYQSISRNGASSRNLKNFIESLSRNQALDQPAIVIYAMIGNDVCNGKADTVPEMTTPEKMYFSVMQTLKHLNSQLPNGSHVILYGLPDGTFLWDSLHNQYHPLGQLNKDVTYAHFFSFLSCLQVSPCNGWMSSNKTLRTLTSQRAEQLSNTLKKIATTETFTNFNLFYMDFVFHEIIEEWQKRGGQPWQLIEPVDGFHPNEVASLLLADRVWKKIQSQWPQILGKENPFNSQIEEVFGDQGGH